MTNCDQIRPRLTAYLDGELSDDRGSVVRGHLRECAACREIARDEAALRDGLRHLPVVDPPASLWAGVQAQLAAAEVADAKQPRWRRALVRLRATVRGMAGRFALGGLVVATAVMALYWRTHRTDEVPLQIPTVVKEYPSPSIQGSHQETSPTIAADVTEDLLADADRTTASYAQTIDELMKLASEARGRWTTEQRAAFDQRVAGLRDGIAHAAQARPRQRAQRTLIRYLQGAVVRDEVALIDIRAAGGTR
jgi:putative zinc finger protein